MAGMALALEVSQRLARRCPCFHCGGAAVEREWHGPAGINLRLYLDLWGGKRQGSLCHAKRSEYSRTRNFRAGGVNSLLAGGPGLCSRTYPCAQRLCPRHHASANFDGHFHHSLRALFLSAPGVLALWPELLLRHILHINSRVEQLRPARHLV